MHRLLAALEEKKIMLIKDMRGVSTVSIEAFVIGVMNIIMTYLIERISPDVPKFFAIFLSGFLIHVVFEVVGANAWWCKTAYD